jgi:hypothetical protein
VVILATIVVATPQTASKIQPTYGIEKSQILLDWGLKSGLIYV